MAILGNNGADTSYLGGADGRLAVSKFTLAAAATLNELHGRVTLGSGSATVRIIIYKHASGGVPDGATLVAYTSPIAIPGSLTEVSQSGFSVALAAADYWIGYRFNIPGGSAGYGRLNSTGGYNQLSGGAADPPAATFPTTDASGSGTVCCWAVVGAAAAAPTSGFMAFT